MIAAKDNFPQLTPEEYFAWEEKQTSTMRTFSY